MEKITYLYDRIWNMTKIPVRYIDKLGLSVLYARGYEKCQDPVLCDDLLCKALLKKTAKNTIPILVFEDVVFVYGIFMDAKDNYVILGPICLEPTKSNLIPKYLQRHSLKSEYGQMNFSTLDVLCSALAITYFMLTGEMVREIDIMLNDKDLKNNNLLQYEFQAYNLTNTEHDIPRFSYEEELNYMGYISNGQPEAIRNHLAPASIQKVGKFAQSAFKQYEYLACSAITLAARAAIQGGLEPLVAYALSDLGKQKLEKCKTINEIIALQFSIRIDFAERVKQQNQNKNASSHIERCKNYIANHLNVNFSLDDIAREAGLNKSYLSRYFSEKEGVGIQKYTQIERIKAAANMLKYSNESITAISTYLCFPSQSHFGKIFKEYMGVTPQKYRNKEKPVDFKAAVAENFSDEEE